MGGVTIPIGFHVTTKGPSLVYSLEDNYAWLDSAGIEVPIVKENEAGTFEERRNSRRKNLFQKMITDEIQKEFLIKSSNSIIIVVGVLSITEQKFINLVSRQYKKKNKFVIHNFYQITTMDAIIQKISQDIVYSFNVVPQNFTNPKDRFPVYFLDYSTNTYHFVIGHHTIKNPNFSRYFNQLTFEYIKKQGATTYKTLNFLKEFQQTFSVLMKKIYSNPDTPDREFVLEDTEDSNNSEEENYERKQLICKNSNFKENNIFLNVDVNEVGELMFGRKLSFEHYCFVGKIEKKQFLFVDLCLISSEKKCEFKDVEVGDDVLIINFTNAHIEVPMTSGEIEIDPTAGTLQDGKPEFLKQSNVMRVKIPISFKKRPQNKRPDEFSSHLDAEALTHLKELKLLKKDDHITENEIQNNKKFQEAMFQDNIASENVEIQKITHEKPKKQNQQEFSSDKFYDVFFEIQEKTFVPREQEKIVTFPENDLKLEEIKILIKIDKIIEHVFNNIRNWKIVSFTGLYNKGKTFILSKIFGCQNPSDSPLTGFDQITKGLCIKIDEQNHILYLDSEGFERAITKKWYRSNANLYDNDFELRLRAIREKIYQQFILEHSDIIVIVLSQLTNSDQKLLERIKSWKNIEKKKIIILHNFHDLASVSEVKEKIVKLSNYFYYDNDPIEFPKIILQELKEKNLQLENLNREYFEEEVIRDHLNSIKISHIFFANDTSIAGKYYNETSLSFLKNTIATTQTQPVDIVEKFLNYANEIMKEHFKIEENTSIKISGRETPVSKPVILEMIKSAERPDIPIKVASTKAKINDPISVNRIVLNFMGEVESLENCKPIFSFKTEAINNKIFKGIITLQFPFSKKYYIIEKIYEPLKINPETKDLDFLFYITKTKYKINPADLQISEFSEILDKTTSGLSRLKFNVMKGMQDGKRIKLLSEDEDEDSQKMEINDQGELVYTFNYSYAKS